MAPHLHHHLDVVLVVERESCVKGGGPVRILCTYLCIRRTVEEEVLRVLVVTLTHWALGLVIVSVGVTHMSRLWAAVAKREGARSEPEAHAVGLPSRAVEVEHYPGLVCAKIFVAAKEVASRCQMRSLAHFDLDNLRGVHIRAALEEIFPLLGVAAPRR